MALEQISTPLKVRRRDDRFIGENTAAALVFDAVRAAPDPLAFTTARGTWRIRARVTDGDGKHSPTATW